jgi:hypothetical protein
MVQKSLRAALVLILATLFVVSDLGASLIASSDAVAQQKKRQGVFQRLFRPRDAPPEMAIQPRAIPPRGTTPRRSPNKRPAPQASGMRTLCVRTCDGYYFPISHSASRKRFKIDEAVCKAMYGGAEARLFVHHNGSPPEAAVSLKGRPLAGEPYAFAYRESFNETCQVQLKDGLDRLTAAFLAKAAEQSSAELEAQVPASRALPNPPSRAVAGIDPETLANRDGSFLVRPASHRDAAVAAASKIRKLGSDYYYVDAFVIETLRHRPPRGPEFTLIGSAKADQRGLASATPSNP